MISACPSTPDFSYAAQIIAKGHRQLASLLYFIGTIRLTQVAPYGFGTQSQSGPNDDEPASLNGGGYSTDKTKAAAINASTAVIAANSPKLKDNLEDFDGFQRNLGKGLFINCGANRVKGEGKEARF